MTRNRLLVLGVVMALGGCAAEPRTEVAKDETAATQHCVHGTGTQVRAWQERCLASTGKSYTGEELSTIKNAPTVEEMLNRLGHGI